MKRIYLSFFVILATLSANSQTPTFELHDEDNASALVANNANFSRNVAPTALSQHSFSIKNISAVSQTVNIRRYDDLLNTVTASDMAQAVFCTGSTCYPPTTSNASLVLGAGQSLAFVADLTEASVAGESDIHYRFTNANDASDVLYVYFKYNVPTGIIKQTSLIANVSNVFPNPSNSKAFITINTVKEMNTQINIINLLGSVVNSTSIDLDKGKNTILLNTEDLNAGVYFVSLTNGNTVITRKITITK